MREHTPCLSALLIAWHQHYYDAGNGTYWHMGLNSALITLQKSARETSFDPPPPPLKRLYQHGDLGKDKCFYTPLNALVRVRQRWISFWNRKLHVQAVIPASPPEGEMTWYLGSCGSFNTRAFTQSSHTDSVALVLYSCPSLSEPQPSSSCHHLCLNIYGRTVKPMLSSTRRWICAGHAFVRQIIPRTGWKVFLYSGSYNVGS